MDPSTAFSVHLSESSEHSSRQSWNQSQELLKPQQRKSLQSPQKPSGARHRQLPISQFKSKKRLNEVAPQQSLQSLIPTLNKFEREEITHYKQVYFLGVNAEKVVPDYRAENCGYTKHDALETSLHDHIAYRYEILEHLSSGKFSHVYRALDHKDHKEVAVKIIKNVVKLFEYSLTEIKILKTLERAYHSSSRSITLDNHFVFRNHRVLVFPMLCKNLFQYMNKRPLSINKIIRFSRQILCGVSQIHGRGILHCDLKPENIMLCDPEGLELKLIDFGVSCFQNKRSFHYVQSRHYRAPEVLLDCPYSTAIDMWSFGCVLIEMALGHPLFKGEDEQQQLLSIMQYLGYPPIHMLNRARKARNFFRNTEEVILVPDSNGKTRIPGTRKWQQLFKDPVLVELIERCLVWDPQERITPIEALNSPLFEFRKS